MLRNQAAAVALMLLSQAALGLGLGTLKQSSALNEPFDGRIDILGATAQDFDTILVKLADSEHFERAGVRRDAVLLQLKFKVVEGASGGDYIKVSSREPIREPFLNFLLELNWANGRMIREYTALLDPPIYDPAPRSAPTQSTTVSPPATSPVASDSAAVPGPSTQREYTGAPATAMAPVDYSAGDMIGPVQVNDTLWSIAKARLPQDGVSMHQMMLALLRTNPEAFGSGNVNILKRGAVLRMPEESELTVISRAEALAEVERQHQLWSGYREAAAERVSEAPLQAAPEPDYAAIDEPEAVAERPTTDGGDARLELVAPGSDDDSMGAGAADQGDADVTLVREELDAQMQENAELQARIAEANEIIDLMSRQVNIKDDELAAMQARLRELGIEAPEDGPAPTQDAVAAADDTDLIDDDVFGIDEDVDTAGQDAVDVEDDLAEDEPVEDVDDLGEVDIDISEDEEQPVAEASATDEAAPSDEVDAGSKVSVFDGLVPAHIAEMVPGGALSVLGAGALLILGVVGLVVKFIRSRPKLVRKGAVPEAIQEAAADEEFPSFADELTALDDTAISDDTADATDIGGEDTTVADLDAQEATFSHRPDMESTTDQLLGEETFGEETVDDPLEEVNVYLAYERFDQAEELVREVIEENPGDHKFKLRLLEVFYSSNNKAGYEEAARTLHDAVGEDSELWDDAVAMWNEMSPDRALFDESVDHSEDRLSDTSSSFVDITSEAETGADTMSMGPAGAADDDAGGLDFDLGSTGDGTGVDVLDLTGTANREMFDVADASVEEERPGKSARNVLDITGSNLDMTASPFQDPKKTAAKEEPTLTTDEERTVSSGDILDITGTNLDMGLDQFRDPEGSDEASAPSAGDILDITGTNLDMGLDQFRDPQDDRAASAPSAGDILDITGTNLDMGLDQFRDPEPSADDGELDKYDITNAELASSKHDDDILDLSSPEPIDELELGAALMDTGAVDVDLSDTLTPYFQPDATGSGGTLNATTPTPDGDEDGLDFDIADLEDTSSAFESAEDTLDIDGGLAFGAEIIDSSEEAGAEGVEFDLSLQSADLDDLSIGSESFGATEDEGSAESEIEFDLSLQDTTEMDRQAIDETLEIPKADQLEKSLEELTKSVQSSIADLDLEDDDELELSLIDESGTSLDFDAALDGGDADEALDFDLDGFDIDDDSGDETVAMGAEGDMPGAATDLSAGNSADTDEVDTKLNLAKAYIELGDKDGARSILDEVARDGTDDQQGEARRLIEQIA